MAYYSKALCLQDHFERDQEALVAWERYLEVVKDIPDQKEWLPQAEARIQQLRKKLSEAAFKRGLTYYAQEQYGQSIAEYDEALRFMPSYAQVYFNRGLAYARLGGYRQALADYEATFQLDPHHAMASYHKALCLQNHLERDQETLTSWERYLEVAQFFRATLSGFLKQKPR
jgi:tetratricopeptide (TPR) repeat protein